MVTTIVGANVDKIIITGIQFLILQVFNLIVIWHSLTQLNKLRWSLITPILTFFGAVFSWFSPILSGILFTAILVGLNYLSLSERTIRILYPLLGLLVSLIVFLLINTIFNSQMKLLHVMAFLIGNGVALIVQNKAMQRLADIIFQQRLKRLIFINYLIIIIILLISTVSFGSNSSNPILEAEFIAILLLTILALLVHFFDTVQKIRQENATRQIQQIENYAQVLEHSYTELRKFKHDYLNVLSASLIFIKNKNFEGLEQYYDEALKIIDTSFAYDDLRINDLQNISLLPLKGLLSYKIIAAYQNNIKIHFECIESVQITTISPVRVVEIVEIILDQAIEYVKNNQGKIDILVTTSAAEYLSLLIRYPLTNDDLIANQTNNLFKTILNTHSVYAHQTLQAIIAAENNLELLNKVAEGFLVQELIIKE